MRRAYRWKTCLLVVAVAAATGASTSGSAATTAARESGSRWLALPRATATTLTAAWQRSDARGVVYLIYRDGVRVGTTRDTTYTFLGLRCGSRHVLAVRALDAAGRLVARDSVSAGTRRCSRTVWRRVFFDDFVHGLAHSRWGSYSGQPGGDPGGWYDPSHVVVSNGVMNLETYRDPRFGRRWVSGGVSSAPGLKQTYGKYDVRFRVDAGRGVGVALLLWPVADHWPPEIDFGEHGGETRAREHMTATLHYGDANNQIQRTVRADFTHWHTLGVEWTPGRLVYTLDGRPWARLTSPHVPREPMEMDLQAPAGTCGDRWAPCPDATTPAHVNMQVDSVVAYAYRPRRR